MPYNSRDERRKAERRVERYRNDYISRFTALLHNSVSFENIGELPKRYLMRTLIRNGAIAYDYATGLYLRFAEIGLDVYGLPRQYRLYGFDGFNVTREANEVCILRANDLQLPLLPYIEMQVNKIVKFDTAIEQNLTAIRTFTIAEVEDKETLLSMVNLIDSREVGSTLAFVNKNLAGGLNGIKVQSTGAQYLISDLLQDRQKIINETLSYLGIPSSNTDKKERVQGLEVTASISYTKSCIDTLVDTFNYDAKYGNIPIRAMVNTDVVSFNEENENTNKNKGEENEEFIEKDN